MYNTNASKKELLFTTALGVGSKGAAVKKLQEWLNLQGQGICPQLIPSKHAFLLSSKAVATI